MPSFSRKSINKLSTCDPRLIEIFSEVIKHIDCTVIVGARGQKDQDELFRQGKSKLMWPRSKHNITRETPMSLAVDVVPYPIDWNDWHRFYHFAGFVQATALAMGYKVRSGLDWDQDFDFNDQNFNDAPHFELVEL